MKRQRSGSMDKRPKTKKYVRKDTPMPLTIVSRSPVEKKFVDLAQTSIALNAGSATGSSTFLALTGAQLCNGLAPGTAANNRVGRKIVLKSMYVRLNAYGNQASANGGYLRMVIFYDKQANGAIPAGGVGGAATSLLSLDNVYSANNLYASDRYVTIFDKIIGPLSGVSNPGAPPALTRKYYKKINLPVIFNSGTAGTVADIATGAVHISFAHVGFPTGPAVDYMVRTRFVDE